MILRKVKKMEIREPDSTNTSSRDINYEVDAAVVAEAIIHRVNQLADERANYRRALIRSVEMLVSGDVDETAVAA